MLFSSRRLLALAATTIVCVSAASKKYFDAETGITFSESIVPLSLTANMAVRIALPDTAQSFQPYDVVVQIVSPKTGWTGIAFGATMLRNPLLVWWAYNNQAVVSSRYAVDRVNAPPAATGTTLELFKTGTRVNATTVQWTALCKGCTSYLDGNDATRYVGPSGTANRFAFAALFQPVNSANNMSSFGHHEVNNIWTQDFSIGKNPDWESLLIKNLGHA